MANINSDTIPDTINGSNPVIAVNSSLNGFATKGSLDTDVYRLELKAGQGYLLQAAKLGSWDRPAFTLLDENGDVEAASVIRFSPLSFNYYTKNSDYFLKYDVDTTLYFSVQGQFRTTGEYTIRLSEADEAASTDQNDTLVWDNTHDVYNGGDGVDTLSFSHFTNPVQIVLYRGLVRGDDIDEPSSRISILNVERIEGTNGDDTFSGDYFSPGFGGAATLHFDGLAQDMTWIGLGGNDNMGSTRGVTVFDGGGGIDTADFSGASGDTAMNLSLLTGMADGGDATGDRFISIENLIAGYGNDTLTGDHGDNALNGGRGFDRLIGLGGDDTLDGGGPAAYGPSNFENLDRAVFRYDRSEYSVAVSQAENGELSAVVEHTGGDQSDGRDTVLNIAWLEFADRSEFIGQSLDTIPDTPAPNSPVMTLGQVATVRSEYPGDVDLYAIDLIAGETYRFARDTGMSFIATEFTLLNGAGQDMGVFGFAESRENTLQHEFVTFQVPQSGRYYVKFAQDPARRNDDTNFGFSVDPEIGIRIDRMADETIGTSGDDTLRASEAELFVDAKEGQDLFLSDFTFADLTPQAFFWHGYLSQQVGEMPSFFLHRVGGRLDSGAYVQRLIDMQVKNVETFVGSDDVDIFKIVSATGHRHTGRLTFEGKGGNDTFQSTLGANHFDGGAGVDKVFYSPFTSIIDEDDRGVHVDLRAGVGRHGAAERDTFASIEWVVGTDLNDVLIGAANTVRLEGRSGSDWFTAGPNGHIIYGGDGTDMVSFVNLPEIAGRPAIESRLVITTETVKQYGSNEIAYTLDSIENITGSVFNDEIEGNGGDNLLRGSGGYDWFIATEGEDTIDGGSGKDMISFVKYQSTDANVISDIFSSNGLPPTGAQASGVLLNLADPSVNTKLADGLTLTSVERVTGSARQDVFYGDDGENDFRGLGGYDWFVSSTGGRERYFGGDGVDTVTYFNAASGVTANLSNGARVDGRESGYGSRGVAARDLYFEIENLVGSRFADELRGSSARNQLNGLEGDDLLFGYGGTDYLMGGLGNDRIYGGSGSDYAIFSGNAAGYQLSRAGNTVTVSGADGVDTLIDVEYFRFDDTDVSIWSL